jgi:hypothetical protein
LVTNWNVMFLSFACTSMAPKSASKRTWLPAIGVSRP